jgi:hypothetical protein
MTLLVLSYSLSPISLAGKVSTKSGDSIGFIYTPSVELSDYTLHRQISDYYWCTKDKWTLNLD